MAKGTPEPEEQVLGDAPPPPPPVTPGSYPCEPKPGLAGHKCPVWPGDYDTRSQPAYPQES